MRKHQARPNGVSVSIISNMCCSIELKSAAPLIALVIRTMLIVDRSMPTMAALTVNVESFLANTDERSGLRKACR